MTTDGWIVTLMAASAILEVAGILTVVAEMRGGRRRAQQWLATGNPALPPAQMTYDQLRNLGPVIVELLAGPRRSRVVGVALLLAGLVLAASANVWSVLA